jgi:hypothetical protein
MRRYGLSDKEQSKTPATGAFTGAEFRGITFLISKPVRGFPAEVNNAS